MRILKTVLIVLVVICIGYAIYSNLPLFPLSSRANAGKILVTTHWMGEGLFARFTPEPESNTLGCWSTTLAQIVYFHRLIPRGSADYACSKGYVIKEDWADYSPDFSTFVSTLDSLTLQASINEVARYCYSIATVVQKDFGTGRYMTKMPPVGRIKNQLGVDAKLFLVYKGLFHSKRKMRNIVIREIESNRPLYLYYRNMDVKGSGHSVVLDGYQFRDGRFFGHLNFGWGGRKDGWYDLFDNIAIEGDTQLRMYLTVRPKSNHHNEF